jgi:hypothetical protein
MKPTSLLLTCLIGLAAIPSTNAQLIINGGFETPDTPTYIRIDAGQNTIAPWVVGLHSVDVGDAVGNGFLVGPAFEGAQQLDLNGLGRGRLTQAFATTPGVLYTVTFAYANSYPNSSTPASATVRVFDGLGDRLNQTITHTGSVAGNLNWTVFTAQFTALQNTTSLEFTSLTDSGGWSGGILLDAVQVFESPPLATIRTSQVEVCWNSQSNVTYQVQYRSDLTTNLWTSLVNCVRSTNSTTCIYDPIVAGQPSRFYRVLLTNCVP